MRKIIILLLDPSIYTRVIIEETGFFSKSSGKSGLTKNGSRDNGLISFENASSRVTPENRGIGCSGVKGTIGLLLSLFQYHWIVRGNGRDVFLRYLLLSNVLWSALSTFKSSFVSRNFTLKFLCLHKRRFFQWKRNWINLEKICTSQKRKKLNLFFRDSFFPFGSRRSFAKEAEAAALESDMGWCTGVAWTMGRFVGFISLARSQLHCPRWPRFVQANFSVQAHILYYWDNDRTGLIPLSYVG